MPLVILEPPSVDRMDKEESGKALFRQEVQLGNRIRREGHKEGLEVEIRGCISAGQAWGCFTTSPVPHLQGLAWQS